MLFLALLAVSLAAEFSLDTYLVGEWEVNVYEETSAPPVETLQYNITEDNRTLFVNAIVDGVQEEDVFASVTIDNDTVRVYQGENAVVTTTLANIAPLVYRGKFAYENKTYVVFLPNVKTQFFYAMTEDGQRTMIVHKIVKPSQSSFFSKYGMIIVLGGLGLRPPTHVQRSRSSSSRTSSWPCLASSPPSPPPRPLPPTPLRSPPLTRSTPRQINLRILNKVQ